MISSLQSFVLGMGSAFDLYGTFYLVSFREKTDREKLIDDWSAIGNDIRTSYSSKLNLMDM